MLWHLITAYSGLYVDRTFSICRDLLGAEDWFRRAIQIKPDFRSALFNLALLLADDHRPLEAAPFLNQLVKYHPDHVKGLILLGDIYINNIKDLDAAENVSDEDSRVIVVFITRLLMHPENLFIVIIYY